MCKSNWNCCIAWGICFILSFGISIQSTANTLEIKGKIVDSKNRPAPYVFVSLASDSTVKCVSTLNGTFALKLPQNTKFPQTLTFSSVNYKTKSYKITSASKTKKNISIKLVTNPTPSEIFAKRKEERAKREKERLAKLEHSSAKKNTTLKGESEELHDFATMESIDRTSIAAEPTAEMDAMYAKSAVPPPNQPDAAAGLLTAGELNDFAKWDLWQDVATDILQEHQKVWQILPQQRYVAQLTNLDNMPIQNAVVSLKDKLGNVVWQTYTDNTGKAELWAQMLNDYLPNFGAPYSIEFNYDNQTESIEAYPFKERINTVRMNAKCADLTAVDIDFVVDATGSMGDEIRYLQAELYDVIAQTHKNNPHIDLQTASLFYWDWTDSYLVDKSDFSKEIDTTINFMKQKFATGGGDLPEAVDVALYESIENRAWRENALAKIVFLILDAPPHDTNSTIKQLHRQIRLAAMKGIRIVPLVCSGANKSTEYLMRSIALATNGTYVFLTDESGIGGSHMKPTTDEYEVEKLNHILLRIITEYSKPANCSNNWAMFDENLNKLEQYLPKPSPDAPNENTQRIEISDLMNVYPTPSNGELTVDIYKDASVLYLSDITGKVLQYFDITAQRQFALQLNNYANGTYFVHVLYEGRWYTHKFLLSM